MLTAHDSLDAAASLEADLASRSEHNMASSSIRTRWMVMPADLDL
jgi:hypothetical protein